MKNKIIIPTSLGLTVIVLLVAFVSFGMVDENNTDIILTTNTELEYVNVSQKLSPPAGSLFNSEIFGPGSYEIDFDSNEKESEYDYLVNVLPKYDDILVYDVYNVFEYTPSSEEADREYIEFLKGGMIYDDVIDDFVLSHPSDEEILMELELLDEHLKLEDGKVLDEFVLIYLSQDPLDGLENSADYTQKLEGITIRMDPKGDFTTDELLGNANEDSFVHEVSQRIVGLLTPMKHVILVNDYDDREIPHTYPAHFGYNDDEYRISITGAITNEQISALAMALSDYKK